MRFYCKRYYVAVSCWEFMIAIGWWGKGKPILFDGDFTWAAGKLWCYFRIGPLFFMRVPGARFVHRDEVK